MTSGTREATERLARRAPTAVHGALRVAVGAVLQSIRANRAAGLGLARPGRRSKRVIADPELLEDEPRAQREGSSSDEWGEPRVRCASRQDAGGPPRTRCR
jgi:hypothetical protein